MAKVEFDKSLALAKLNHRRLVNVESSMKVWRWRRSNRRRKFGEGQIVHESLALAKVESSTFGERRIVDESLALAKVESSTFGEGSMKVLRWRRSNRRLKFGEGRIVDESLAKLGSSIKGWRRSNCRKFGEGRIVDGSLEGRNVDEVWRSSDRRLKVGEGRIAESLVKSNRRWKFGRSNRR